MASLGPGFGILCNDRKSQEGTKWHGQRLIEMHHCVVNKENVEHQNHMKKLQAQCPHHHQHQNYDPDDIVAKLQTKLRSIDATEDIIEHDKEDSVSINSSVSQDKYHQSCHHHHQHSHHHHHHHMHSGHETPKVNIIYHWSCLVAYLEN